MNTGPWLSLGDLNSVIANRRVERRQDEGLGGTGSGADTQAASDSILPLAEVERRAILRTIEHTKGDRTFAAELLGIGRTTLYRKLKEYGL
jgi:DNA-binding NtrC family response regulator